MSTPTISTAHRYAVYEYTDKVSDPYYRGKRFISANTPDAKSDSDRMVIVATADTTEECAQHIDQSPMRLVEWMCHQNAQTGGALGRMLAGEDDDTAQQRVRTEAAA